MNRRRIASLAGWLALSPVSAAAALIWLDVVAYLAEAAEFQLQISGASHAVFSSARLVLNVGLFCLPPLVLGWRLARTGDLRWAPLVVLWSGSLPMRMVWTLCGSDPSSSDYSMWPVGLIAAVIASVVAGSAAVWLPWFVWRLGRATQGAGGDREPPAPLLGRFRGRAAWALLYTVLGTGMLIAAGPLVVIATWLTAPDPALARWVWLASLGAVAALMTAAIATCPDPGLDAHVV